MEINPSSLGGWLSALWQLAWGAMTFDAAAFSVVLEYSRGTLLALLVLLIGGFSYFFGQSAVLFANRIPPRRFLLSLLAGAIGLWASVFFWSASLWVVVSLLLGTRVDLGNVVAIVALSFAPYWLGFLILFPYLGSLFSKVLRGWVALVLLMAVAVSFDLAFWQALLACALGWGVFELLNRVPLLDLDRLEAWLWREGAGKTLQRDVDSLVDDMSDKGGE